MNSQVSDLWLEMALDTVEAARDHMPIREFDRRIKLMPHIAGAGYIDRARVLDDLIATQIIGIDERHLTLGQIDGIDWILSGLASGNEVAWSIAEIVDRRGRIVKKFDSEKLVEIGRIGEDAVVKVLREKLSESRARRIKHVSLEDDLLGYDIIAPSLHLSDRTNLLEVKTSVRPGNDFNFFISSNEYRVGLNNSNWFLVCVRIVRDQPEILGHIPISQISDLFPTNQDESIKWSSCRVAVSRELLITGLP